MKPVRVGIIGYGRIGAEHASWIDQSGTCEVAGVFDVTPARAQMAAAAGRRTFASLEALLASDADAVLVSNPTAMHYETAVSALDAGKAVMVEKPVTLDLPQARRLAAAAGRQVISVFHNRRWDADVLAVQQTIRSGALGRVINVESRLTQWSSCVGPAAREYRPNWRNERGFGGGGLYDWGSHFIDQLWRLMLPARPTAVFAQLRGNVWSDDCDDFARVCVNFDSGAVGLMEINTTSTRPLPRWHIDGTEGSADAPASASYDTGEWARLQVSRADGKAVGVPPPPAGLTEAEIWRRFGVAVREHGEPAVPIQSVLPTMALLDAARESSRTGLAVPLEPV